MKYKLLTPGPLTTTDTVKQTMMVDHCTWDDEYKEVTQKIRKELLEIAHANSSKYTTILMQGSGTFGVESVITSVIGKKEKMLVCANGAYGERIAEIAAYAGINHVIYRENYDAIIDCNKIDEVLEKNKDITHIAMIHSETTSGILNDIESVAKVAKKYNKTFIVDAMSSFGGIDIDVEKIGIDFLISSANKCIQGVPGFSFVIANIEKLKASKGNARSLALDLYAQYEVMEKNKGKWRFTSPTHAVLAFSKALEELKEEGGVPVRFERYSLNNNTIRQRMKKLGIKTYIGEKYQSPIITTFILPDVKNFNFRDMYHFIRDRGYIIYPGKVTDADTFRIGNIGDVYKEDMDKVADIIKEYLEGLDD